MINQQIIKSKTLIHDSWLVILFPILFIFTASSNYFFISPEEILILLMGLFLIAKIFASGKAVIINSDTFIIFAIFCLVYFFSLLSRESIGASHVKIAISLFGTKLLLIYLIYTSIKSFSFFKKVIGCLIAIGLILVIIGGAILLITQDINYFRSTIYFSQDYFSGFLKHTVFFNPNFYSRTLLFIMPFFLLPIINLKSIKYKLACLAGIIGVVLMTIFTFSRMSMIALSILILLIVYKLGNKKIKKRKAQFFLTTFFIALILITQSFIIERFENKISQYKNQDTTLRIEMIKVGLKSFYNNPILGTGPGSAKEMLSQDPGLKKHIYFFKGNRDEFAMHNNFLLILVETGLVGLLLFLMFLCSYWRYINKIKQNLKPDQNYLSTVLDAVRLSFIAFILTGLTAVNLGMNIIWFILALPFVIDRIRKE